MCVIHEVEQVEVGEFYIVVDNKTGVGSRYVKIDIWDDGDSKTLIFTEGAALWNLQDAQNRGARFYGPVQLQPAQESAAGGEQ